jgi:hypothetical protein
VIGQERFQGAIFGCSRHGHIEGGGESVANCRNGVAWIQKFAAKQGVMTLTLAGLGRATVE